MVFKGFRALWRVIYRAAGESDDGVRRDRKVSVINEKSMVLFAFFGYKRKSRRNFAGGQDGYGHKKGLR